MQELSLKRIDKLSRKELRQAIEDCFEEAPETSPVDRLAILQEAQFYTRELERRHDSWISLRDLVLEIAVIALIGWEIYMGYHQQWQQDQAFQKEQAIWMNMERSSQATATKSEATEKILGSLQTTTEIMNGAVQTQLGLLYEVNVITIFDNETKRIGITNVGRTPVTIVGSQFWDMRPEMEVENPRIVAPGTSYTIDGTAFHDAMAVRIPKIGDGEFVPWVIYLRNEAGKKITVRTYLAGKWEKDTLVIRTQIVSIRQEEWPNSIAQNKAKTNSSAHY
jgi:uncharacterized FlaG/YvyC family protein